MAQGIRIYRGAAAEPLPGLCGASVCAGGFVLERHEVPPGELGDMEFRCHLVALERNPTPFRLTWKEDGMERNADTGPGHVFIRSQQPMRGLRTGGTQRCIALSIDPEAMELALPEPFSGRPVELVVKGIGCDVVANHLFAVLEEELDGDRGTRPLLLESLGKALAVYVASRFSANPPTLPSRCPGLDRKRLTRVLEYMDAHLASDLSLEELAGIACLSSYHFGRMFKASTGETVHHFVLRRRIDRSKAMLAQKECSLEEVAAAIGFGSQSQFTTTFRQLTGLPPGAWRRNLRGR